MRVFKRRERVNSERALTEVLEYFPGRARRALYAATNNGSLRQRTWDGCALNQAGAAMGRQVWSTSEASRALMVSDHHVRRFLQIWDTMPGSHKTCTAGLRDKLLEVGLFPEVLGAEEHMTEEDFVAQERYVQSKRFITV